MSDYYDRDGNPISMPQWTQLLDNPEYVTIGRTRVGPDLLVSTVWLGLNHSITALRIFETMIFHGDLDDDRCWGNPVFQDRYATETAAIAGHDRAVAAARNIAGPGAVTEDVRLRPRKHTT